MTDWLGLGLIALGVGLLISGVMKRRARMVPLPAGAIRPEFAAMGDMIRPIILFFLAVFAAKISFFYLVLGGERFLSQLDFAGILFVLASYAVWLVLATRPRSTALATSSVPIETGPLPAPAPGE
jgi:hypothetical protein